MAVLSVGNDGNFERFLTFGTSQTTKPCCCIITLQYALLQGYKILSSTYYYYELYLKQCYLICRVKIAKKIFLKQV